MFEEGLSSNFKKNWAPGSVLISLPLKEAVTRGSPYTELVPEIRVTKSVTESFDSYMGAVSVARKVIVLLPAESEK